MNTTPLFFSHLTPNPSTDPFSLPSKYIQNHFSDVYLFPKYLSPGCLQYFRNYHACFSLCPLHPSLNTAASMNLAKCSSDKASPLLESPQKYLISPGRKAKTSHNGLQGPARSDFLLPLSASHHSALPPAPALLPGL